MSDDASNKSGQPKDATRSGKSTASTSPPKLPKSALPKIDFSTFILSLSTSALYQMGQVRDSTTGERAEPNRVLAQQTIDTLEMLRDKTLSNLDPEEKKLFDSLLYELRMKFVETRR
jgi:hypothetical protein